MACHHQSLVLCKTKSKESPQRAPFDTVIPRSGLLPFGNFSALPCAPGVFFIWQMDGKEKSTKGGVGGFGGPGLQAENVTNGHHRTSAGPAHKVSGMTQREHRDVCLPERERTSRLSVFRAVAPGSWPSNLFTTHPLRFPGP